jgi:SAM-dependent methyltransferase
MTEQGIRWKSVSGKAIPTSASLHGVIFDYISSPDRVLDLGCGPGRTCEQLIHKGFQNVFGVDLNAEAIEEASAMASGLGLANAEEHFQKADATSLPYQSSFFDCVITQAFWTSILPQERHPIMLEISRVQKPGAIFYAGIWAQTWRLPAYRERYLSGIAEGLPEGTFKVLDKQTGRLRYIAHHFSEREIVEMHTNANFEIQKYICTEAPTQSGNLINFHVVISRNRKM